MHDRRFEDACESSRDWSRKEKEVTFLLEPILILDDEEKRCDAGSEARQ